MQWTVAAKAAAEAARGDTSAEVFDAAIALAEESAAIAAALGHNGAVDLYTFERALSHAKFAQAGERWLVRQETEPETGADGHLHTWRALPGRYETGEDAEGPGAVMTWYRARCRSCGLTWEHASPNNSSRVGKVVRPAVSGEPGADESSPPR
jgi:hypothetical protein